MALTPATWRSVGKIRIGERVRVTVQVLDLGDTTPPNETKVQAITETGLTLHRLGSLLRRLVERYPPPAREAGKA